MTPTLLVRLKLVATLVLAMTGFAQAAGAADASPAQAVAAPLQQLAAMRLPRPEEGMILGAVRAGRRVVAVGDRGLVLLSDDDGKTYRQAKDMPTRATLTAVWAIDASTLWAVGHWGTMLVSHDADETWAIRRSDIARDQPLLSVCFIDAKHGVAAGLFSLLLVTDDGATWREVKLPAPTGGKKADLNLFQAFADKRGGLWIAAEQGAIYHSTDQGQSWSALSTGSKGTLWSGLAADDGSISVGGFAGEDPAQHRPGNHLGAGRDRYQEFHHEPCFAAGRKSAGVGTGRSHAGQRGRWCALRAEARRRSACVHRCGCGRGRQDSAVLANRSCP